MEREKLGMLINNADWRGTSYLAPHEYVLSRDYPELQEALETYLIDHGYRGSFLNQEYTYVNIGAYRYWIVEGVLNRARLDTPGVREVKDGSARRKRERIPSERMRGHPVFLR